MNKVGTLKTCKDIMGFNDDEDVNCELKTDFECVHNLNIRDFDYGLILRMRSTQPDVLGHGLIVGSMVDVSLSDWVDQEGVALKVTEIYKVPFAIRKHYNELVTCDVVDIEACHVLLGRPWKYDMNATHQENKTLVTLVASPKEFQAERKEMGVSYTLVMKGVEDVMKNAIPAVIKPLLAEFGKIVMDDAPDAWLPLRNIQHQIDLSRKTTLLVSISNEILGFDSIKELYTNDEDFGNICMELETKQHPGEAGEEGVVLAGKGVE
nr:putative nucleotidyltransferase, ribonuclease H [Tanacetum cinerariifolium]